MNYISNISYHIFDEHGRATLKSKLQLAEHVFLIQAENNEPRVLLLFAYPRNALYINSMTVVPGFESWRRTWS